MSETSESTNEIISRKTARLQGLKRFYTGRPCKHGHTSARFVSSGACVICSDAKFQAYKQLNKEACRLANKRWWQNNPHKNRQKVRQWQRNNPDKVATHKAKRRAARLQACPKWVDLGELNEIYTRCRMISRQTGVLHHVDHVIPLRGKIACGLHVPWNLRIITAAENVKKGVKILSEVADGKD